MNTEVIDKKSRYFSSIDGLRFFASLNIVLFHLESMGGFNAMNGSPGWFFRLIKGPTLHATFFFFLGGFIFTTKFFPGLECFNLKQFLVKRFRELYPLHLFTTLLMTILFVIREFSAGTLDIPKMGLSVFLHLSFLWPFFPFNTYALNRPSWALATFFFCYLLFGVMLQLLKKIDTKQKILLYCGILFLPSLLWDWLFALSGAQDSLYQFFHAFPLLRGIEFFIGMLLARFFMLTPQNKSHNTFITSITSDICMAVLFYLIYQMMGVQNNLSASGHFFTYHTVLPMFFLCVVFLFASENGLFSRFFAIKLIRDIGRSSFYPYLLHIPYFAWITFIAEAYFNNNTLLHKPLIVWMLIIILYTGSYIYVNKFKKKQKIAQKGFIDRRVTIRNENVIQVENAETVKPAGN
ncbi:MAG: acyltransferase [Chitinispirillaceae bacterium]|nr:acyltransferase [Chitinispirillaceae bacterium]